MADLQCELDGAAVRVRTIDGKIILTLPNLRSGLKLIRLGTVRRSLRITARRLKQMLDSLAASLEVRIDEIAIASTGYGVGNRLWRILGDPPLTLRSFKVIRFAVRERRS